MQEVKLLSERHEILNGMVGDNRRFRSAFCGEERAGRNEIKSGSATCAEKVRFMEISNERGEARRLQRSGNSRRMKKEADTQDRLSFESSRLPAVDHVEERMCGVSEIEAGTRGDG